MSRFSKPAVGDKIVVVTDYSGLMTGYPQYISRQTTVHGTVISSQDFDDPMSFRVLTNDVRFPVKIITMEYVVALNVLGVGTIDIIEENSPKTQDSKEVFEVEGSKGNTYFVTRQANTFSCSCPGFSFRKSCKHVNGLKTKLMAEGKL